MRLTKGQQAIRDEKILKLQAAGLTYAQLAQRFDLTPARITCILRKQRKINKRAIAPTGNSLSTRELA